MNDYKLTKMATQMFFPGNVAQLDDAGVPSIMVYIPAFKNSDVLTGGDDSTHPAFIVNGKEIPGFYYSKYQNMVHNGAAYSLPAEDPQASVNFDTALNYCKAKGPGWHMSTAAEWAAIALWCKKNGFLPYGNNSYGKDTVESEYKAVPTFFKNGSVGRIATGTGPKTWSHNNSLSGIWDMNGNVWEWQGGIRIVWGEIQILANNNAADVDNPQNKTSPLWKAINATNGSLVEPESKTTDTAVKAAGATVKLDYINEVWTFVTGIGNAAATTRGCAYGSVATDSSIGDQAKMLLRSLALLPEADATGADYGGDRVFWNNGSPECCVFRGGSWDNEGSSGIFYLCGLYDRFTANAQLGFRAAYIPDIIA